MNFEEKKIRKKHKVEYFKLENLKFRYGFFLIFFHYLFT